MSKKQRELLSQNFLWNRELVSKLIRDSSISQNDLVLEIGAGKGIITEPLSEVCKELIAIESDLWLHSVLVRNLNFKSNLSLIQCDFMEYPLPAFEPFKIFSNVPFLITGEIIKKLLLSSNPPVDSYLVVQLESANKFVGKQKGNSMLAMIFYPLFDIQITHKFARVDFRPVPAVDPCLLRITKRRSPEIRELFLETYRDFIVYNFVRDRLATSRSAQEWKSKFDMFLKENDSQLLRKVRGSFVKWLVEEKKLSKIHRTRNDKNWKRL